MGWHTPAEIAAKMDKRRLNPYYVAALEMLVESGRVRAECHPLNTPIRERWEYQVKGYVMGMNLQGAGGAMHIGVEAWHYMLDLAKFGGWKPMGTRVPPIEIWWGDRPWNGSYTANNYQEVTDADALALADALDLVINRQPKHPPNTNIEHIETIRKFIPYCRQGGFLIG